MIRSAGTARDLLARRPRQPLTSPGCWVKQPVRHHGAHLVIPMPLDDGVGAVLPDFLGVQPVDLQHLDLIHGHREAIAGAPRTNAQQHLAIDIAGPLGVSHSRHDVAPGAANNGLPAPLLPQRQERCILQQLHARADCGRTRLDGGVCIQGTFWTSARALARSMVASAAWSAEADAPCAPAAMGHEASRLWPV